MTGPFTETVRAEIQRRGRVTFAEFMEWALTHPRHGYYTAGGRTGRAGDFITNAQVPLFGEALAEIIRDMWDALGSARWTLIELGAGDGVLAERVLSALDQRGRARRVTTHLVEASPAARAAARRRLSRFGGVHIHAALEDLEHTAGVEGCVYSNEFFDALPFHRLRGTAGGVEELFVTDGPEGLRESPGPLSRPDLAAPLAAAGVTLADGQETEVCPAVDAVMDELARVLARGFVVTVDYGGAAAEVHDAARGRGTRRTFSRHRVGDDPFRDVGEKDITAHVDFTRLARAGEARGFRTIFYGDQGPFLLAGAEGTLRAAIEAVPSRGREVQQLVHPAAFGEKFRVLIQSVNAGGATLRFERAARVQRLGLGAPPADRG